MLIPCSSKGKRTSLSNPDKEFNTNLNELQQLKNELLKTLESKKLNTNLIEDKIRQTYKEIILTEFNLIEKSGAIEKYKKTQKRIDEIVQIETPLLR